MEKFLQRILKFLASAIIRKYHPTIIGITGSVGKTGTKNAIGAVLKRHWRVRASLKNYNNELGVPLTIIGKVCPGKNPFRWLNIFLSALSLILIKSKKYPEILALEMGADKPGDLRYLISMAPPEVGIITAIGEAHLEFFKTIPALIREKQTLVSCLPRSGLAVLNRDDEAVWNMRDNTKANLKSVGFHEEAQVGCLETKIKYEERYGVEKPIGMHAKLNYGGSVVPLFLNKTIGEGGLYSAMFAAAVAQKFEINLVEVAECLRTLEPTPGRMSLLEGIKHTVLIDDSYNSSPKACQHALEALSRVNIPEGAERFAILGDMKELGKMTSEAHEEIGRMVAHEGINWLITVGEEARALGNAARIAGLPENRLFHFNTNAEAGRFVQEKLEEHDVVLVKASRAMHFEEIVKELMAEPLKAKELLVSD